MPSRRILWTNVKGEVGKFSLVGGSEFPLDNVAKPQAVLHNSKLEKNSTRERTIQELLVAAAAAAATNSSSIEGLNIFGIYSLGNLMIAEERDMNFYLQERQSREQQWLRYQHMRQCEGKLSPLLLWCWRSRWIREVNWRWEMQAAHFRSAILKHRNPADSYIQYRCDTCFFFLTNMIRFEVLQQWGVRDAVWVGRTRPANMYDQEKKKLSYIHETVVEEKA